MKNLLYLNYCTLIFLFLVAIVGINSAFSMYRQYGFSYEVTTIIQGNESTRTVTLTENLGGGLILLLLFLMFLFNTARLREAPKSK